MFYLYIIRIIAKIDFIRLFIIISLYYNVDNK